MELLERFQIPHPPVEAKLDLSGLELVAEVIKYPGLCLGFLEVSGLESPVMELHQLKVPEWYYLECLEFLPVGQCLPAHHLLGWGLLDHLGILIMAGQYCLHLLGLDYYHHICICIYNLEVLLNETALLFVCFGQQG